MTAEQVRTFEDVAGAGFDVQAQLASAAAWSPNPKNPPFFVDLPTQNGVTNPLVLAKWSANAPLAMVDQYIGNLRRMNVLPFFAANLNFDAPSGGSRR